MKRKGAQFPPSVGQEAESNTTWDRRIYLRNESCTIRYQRALAKENNQPIETMMSPVQITFRNMQPSPAVAARINTEATKLERYYARITSCRVVVEVPHRHHKHGELFHICIELNVPGAELVVRHEPTMHRELAQSDGAKSSKHFEAHAPHKDVYVTIRDAFKAARRQLEDHARRLRGDIKIHGRIPPLRLEKVLAA